MSQDLDCIPTFYLYFNFELYLKNNHVKYNLRKKKLE